MKISDELSKRVCDLFCGYLLDADNCDELSKLADRIDNETVELPKDADGVSIHVGDTVYYCNSGFQMKVLSLSFDGQWHLTTNKAHVHNASSVTHERTDTWQRIANELYGWYDAVDEDGNSCGNPRDLAERIRKLAEKEGE